MKYQNYAEAIDRELLTAQTAKAKADYAGIIKDLETLADVTEIASKVYKTRTKAVEHGKKQKKKNEQSL